MKRAVILIVLAAASTAHAETNDEISAGSWSRTLRSPSANAITDDSLVGGHLTLARDLGLELVPHLSIWVTASVGGGDTSGTMFQTMTTDISYFQVSVGGSARYAFGRHLALGARLDVGTGGTTFTLTNGPQAYSDTRWGAVSEQALFVDLLAIGMRSFAFGIRLELGYAAATAVDLVPRAEGGDGDTLVLPMTQSSFGHLDLSGPFYGVRILGQF